MIRYELALARLMLRNSDTRVAGVRLSAQLAQRDDVQLAEADRLLASGLLRLGVDGAPPELVRIYLQRNPQDSEMKSLREAQQQAIEERGLESAAGLTVLLPNLQHRHIPPGTVLARPVQRGAT